MWQLVVASEGRAMRTRTLSGLECHDAAQRDRTAVHLCVEASGRKAERRRGQEEEAGHRGCGRLAAGCALPERRARAAAPTTGIRGTAHGQRGRAARAP